MISILYVDDECTLLDIGKIFLEDMGEFHVDIVSSAIDALSFLNTKNYDAIISDYQMPVMDGIGLLKRVRSSGNTVPFILFTGKGREEIVIQALNEGADYYLQKGGEPVAQFTELAHQVRQAVQQRRAEASIRDHERREADIINFLPDATFAIDVLGVVIAWNRAMEDMTGVLNADILGKGNFEYALPFYHERRPILIDLVLKDDPVTESKYPYILRSGKKIFSETIIPNMNHGDGVLLWFTASPLYDTKGTIVGAIESIRDISERKRQEDALIESEALFRTLVTNIRDPILILSFEGKILFANPAAYTLIGLAPLPIHEDISITTYLDPQSLSQGITDLKEIETSGGPSIGEYFVNPLHGKKRCVEARGVRIVYNGAEADLVTLRDITDRKRIEEHLQKTVMEYENILANMSDVFYRSDERGNLVLASRSWATLLGYPHLSDCIGRNIASDFYIDPDERTRLLELLYRDGSVTDYEVVLKRKDGSPVTVSTSSYLYRNKEGHILGVEGTFRDISERKRFLENLMEAEQRLTDIINFLPDATFAINRDGRVIAWNRAIEEMTGVSARDMLGKENYEYGVPFYGRRRQILIDLIFSDDADIKKNYSFVKRDGTVLTAETRMSRPGGKNRILWGKASPLFNSRGEITGAIESIRDITDWRILEDTLKQQDKNPL
jgi:PAS domain S-box-containing protein